MPPAPQTNEMNGTRRRAFRLASPEKSLNPIVPTNDKAVRKSRKHRRRKILLPAAVFLVVSLFMFVLGVLKGSTSTSYLRSTSTSSTTHFHEIPNILIFTYSKNLLELQLEDTYDMNSTDLMELIALKQNVQHTIDLHPKSTVRFLTDNDCLDSIRVAMGPDTPLVEYFRSESHGMYKADICRGAALWETGGIYTDVDLGTRLHLFDVLYPNTTFATVRVYRGSEYKKAFFQAFMASTPRHPVVKRYLELFVQYYQGTLQHKISGYLGVQLLKIAYDEIIKEDSSWKETSEIWQEGLYVAPFEHSVFKDIPPPVWGHKRACKFIVVARPYTPAVVPFYSRIANSRQCPMYPKKPPKREFNYTALYKQ